MATIMQWIVVVIDYFHVGFRVCQGDLLEVQQELLNSKAGRILLEGQRRLAEQLTDLQVKTKASELLQTVEKKIAGASDRLEDWVATVKEQVLAQLGANRALLVESLSGLSLQLQQADLRELLSGVAWAAGLLDRFENSSSFSDLPAPQNAWRECGSLGSRG
ncbi:hypothetical protein AK812_SmicGene32739 [Symbiodinium microadriaticum]|uniref:Uncharacterized protein n=1 Tax=Symbiodinium microadriaticum TaxID=2951 RepID=A0A1Q9CTB6_SYMMI|nr:hypothetical protein AK812_SmicGene32739 [Symbiodinium microadriaticum]